MFRGCCKCLNLNALRRTRTFNLLIKSQLATSGSSYLAGVCDEGQPNPSSSPSSQTQIDPDLAVVIASWPQLADHIRQTIMTLVKA